MEFLNLGLTEPIQRVAHAVNYSEPTPIQKQTIPLILEGMDVIAQAQTGTGKTAAFALPILQYLNELTEPLVPSSPRVLVLVPTRELAKQVAETFESFGRFTPRHIDVMTVIGGESIEDQLDLLHDGVDVLVATPGRLLDLLGDEKIYLDSLTHLVIDEADRLLALGFAEELEEIFTVLPKDRQSVLFSATYPKKVERMTKEMLRNPVRVNVIGDMPTLENIKQRAIEVNRLNRRPLLQHLIKEENWEHVLVFVRSKRAAHNLATKLQRNRINAEAFHGDLSQSERTSVLTDFRNRITHVLIATDIAARGIDIQGLSTVINYDLPRSPVDYIHRIGRTGRAGAEGVAITFVGHSDKGHFELIEKRTHVEVEREQILGFELTGEAPVKQKGQAPIKGKRPNKRDKARAAALEELAGENEE